MLPPAEVARGPPARDEGQERAHRGRELPAAWGKALRAAGRPFLEVEARHRAPGQPDGVFGRLDHGMPAAAGPACPGFVAFSHVAHFVEVRVEPRTRRVRVPRVVSVVDCGRVVSPRTARSQVLGGVVWGIGAALREVSEVDPRFGGFLNADLAEYVVPVNAASGAFEVDFIGEPDPLLNAMGVKGLGEVAMVGVAPRRRERHPPRHRPAFAAPAGAPWRTSFSRRVAGHRWGPRVRAGAEFGWRPQALREASRRRR